MEFTKKVYPKKVLDPLYKNVEDHPYTDAFVYPKCMFIPSRSLIRQICTAMVKFSFEESE